MKETGTSLVPMTLSAFNHLGIFEAGAILSTVCGSRRWAEMIIAARPYQSHNELLYTAHRSWWSLTSNEWIEAFSAHGTLTQRLETRTSNLKDSMSPETLNALETTEGQYRQKFGFEVVAHIGATPYEKLLEKIQTRLKNSPGAETRTAAEEQARINRIALEALVPAPSFNSLPATRN